MTKKRVVLTGTSGDIAQRMIQPHQDRYDLVCLDITERTRDGTALPYVPAVDLAEPVRTRPNNQIAGFVMEPP